MQVLLMVEMEALVFLILVVVGAVHLFHLLVLQLMGAVLAALAS